jgi:hypothetical protein
MTTRLSARQMVLFLVLFIILQQHQLIAASLETATTNNSNENGLLTLPIFFNGYHLPSSRYIHSDNRDQRNDIHQKIVTAKEEAMKLKLQALQQLKQPQQPFSSNTATMYATPDVATEMTSTRKKQQQQKRSNTRGSSNGGDRDDRLRRRVIEKDDSDGGDDYQHVDYSMVDLSDHEEPENVNENLYNEVIPDDDEKEKPTSLAEKMNERRKKEGKGKNSTTVVHVRGFHISYCLLLFSLSGK